MKCSLCGAPMRKEKVEVEKTWKGRTIVFRGIEAQICAECGNEIYEATDVAMMESLIEGTLEKPESPQFMDVEEVSKFLRVTPQTVYNMLRDGRISATKVGREWRFMKDSIISAFNIPAQSLACYRSTETGADQVRDEIDKYRAELRKKTEEREEGH